MKTMNVFMAFCLMALLLACKSNTGVNTGSDTTAVEQVEEVTTDVSIVKKYQIKSAIVTFENNMMGTKQKIILYFDDYGTKEAEEKYEGENVKEISLCDGKEMYTIIPSDKTAFTSGSCYRGIAYKFDWNEIAEEDQNTKAKKLPNMTIAGKDCEAYSYDMGSTSTVYAGWNNICLYQNTKANMGEVVKTAVKIEEGVSIPETKLQVPSDYEIKKSGF